MVLTPKDETAGAEASGASEEGAVPSLRRRLRARLRDLMDALPFTERLRSRSVQRGGDGRGTSADPTPLADDAVSPPACPSVPGFPDRQRPFTYPTRNHGEGNSVDLIGIETGGELTISLPENPEARLTSDEWVEVER